MVGIRPPVLRQSTNNNAAQTVFAIISTLTRDCIIAWCITLCVIAHVANSKRHQWRNEMYIIFTRTSGKSAKLFTRNRCHAIRKHAAPPKLDAIPCDQHAFVINAHTGFIQNTPDRVSCKQLCWFPGCAGKNKLDFVHSLVAFGISNIPYWVHNVLNFQAQGEKGWLPLYTLHTLVILHSVLTQQPFQSTHPHTTYTLTLFHSDSYLKILNWQDFHVAQKMIYLKDKMLCAKNIKVFYSTSQ